MTKSECAPKTIQKERQLQNERLVAPRTGSAD